MIRGTVVSLLKTVIEIKNEKANHFRTWKRKRRNARELERGNRPLTPEQQRRVNYALGRLDGATGDYYPRTAEEANDGYDEGQRQGLKDREADQLDDPD